jgi:hypothetical protein
LDADITLPDPKGNAKEIERVDISEVFRYLGGRIDIGKLEKMKSNNERIQKVRKIVMRISQTGLKINQVINAFKTFVLPRKD